MYGNPRATRKIFPAKEREKNNHFIKCHILSHLIKLRVNVIQGFDGEI
jgi:tRNA A37 threonylcarbamoyladenosine synthetase subunit TsaC/SUA5/YrdC